MQHLCFFLFRVPYASFFIAALRSATDIKTNDPASLFQSSSCSRQYQ